MITNTNGGGDAAPHLRCYMNLLALDDLPPFSSGPRNVKMESRLVAIHQAGYDGVQFIDSITEDDIALCERFGLGRSSLGRVNEPGDAEELAERFSGEGQECATLHVGWGMEDDDEAARLIGAVLSASVKYSVPLYVETHRATIFQDMWRTVRFVEQFPSLRFNGDFSHWYTGQEMVYGGFEKKLAFLAPVLERVRYLHGRIGNPGNIQVNIGNGDAGHQPYVDHFRQMWTAAFRGFLDSASPGDYICFAPELLAPRIFYGRVFPDSGDNLTEECDRWEQSLVLKQIAASCFAAAQVEATS